MKPLRCQQLARLQWRVLAAIGVMLLLFTACGDAGAPDIPAATSTASPTPTATGTGYYVDSTRGHDSNLGLSPSAAWQTLAPVNDHAFEPGDTIHFATGASWKTGLIIKRSGTADRPITYTSYGSGPMPVFEKPGGNAIMVIADYVIIDGLFLRNAANDPDIPYDLRGALLIFLSTEHNIVRNSEITNAGVGVRVFGEHHSIEHNYIHDLVLVYDFPDESYGAIGISVDGSNIEVAHNRFENCRHQGTAYGYDGGAIEIEGFTWVKENILIHHNPSTGSQGFIEVTETTTRDVTVAYNISDDYQQFIAWDTTTQPSGFLVEHNTIIREHRQNATPLFTVFYYRDPGSDPDESWLTFRNSIFYTTYAPVLDNSGHPFDYPHDHNLFFAPSIGLDDPVGYPLGPGDVIADPQFVDFGGRDLHLQPSSPAIDIGIDLGYTDDFDSNPVPIGSAPDAGAYEHQGAAPSTRTDSTPLVLDRRHGFQLPIRSGAIRHGHGRKTASASHNAATR